MQFKTMYNSPYVYKALCSIFIVNLFLISNAVAEDQKEPTVPFVYSVGFSKFQQYCSACHGKWGDGTKQGPPLMHPFYVPSHHNDASFYRAALHGVKAHHWQFGDMPKISGVTEKDMNSIVPYIRWLQHERGVIK